MSAKRRPEAHAVDPRDLHFRAIPWESRPAHVVRSRVWERETLAPILEYLGRTWPAESASELVIAGGATDADRPPVEWWQAPATEAGWDVTSVLGERRHGGTYRDPRTGRTVSVRMSAAWFGGERDAAAIRAARDRLTAALRHAFPGSGVHLFGTPGRTGLDLLSRSLPRDHEYAPLGEDERETLWSEYGQGRMEFCAPKGVDEAPDGLYVYDAKWQYAGCTRHVPVAPFTHDSKGEYIPYRPGFYRCEWAVPADWHHIGLLPELTFERDGTARTEWPATPHFASHEGWVSHHELALALRAGWRVAICERILGAEADPPGQGRVSDPLRQWTDKLRRLRAEAEERRDGLLKGALRNILNQGIGHFWRREAQIVVRCAAAEYERMGRPGYAPVYLAADGRTAALADPAIVEYRKSQPVHRDLLQYQRPEWAASVWGASRAMLADATVGISKGRGYPGVPRDALVALRTDGIVTLAPQPALEAGRNVGQFRLKQHIPGPCAIPRTEAAWEQLVGEATEMEGYEDGE